MSVITTTNAQSMGNTFTGLVCAAFGCKAPEVELPTFEQFPAIGMGTVYVRGVAYDYKRESGGAKFWPAQ